MLVALVSGGAALGSGAALAAPAPADPGAQSPGVQFANPNTQKLLGTAYTEALDNLLVTNTVPYDEATYNSTGLLDSTPGTFIRAGGGYAQPWTRDASINSWNA